MRLLALSSWSDLKACTDGFAATPCDMIRPPETGLVMLRGRIGGTGSAFNLGEATVTRCAVRTVRGHEGHAYVMGRNHGHAKLAAVCDALLQDESQHAKDGRPSASALAETYGGAALPGGPQGGGNQGRFLYTGAGRK